MRVEKILLFLHSLLDNVSIANQNNNESQLPTDNGMSSASGVFDNTHDYSDDDGDDYFTTSGDKSNGDDYNNAENGINYYLAMEYPINERVSYFMG